VLAQACWESVGHSTAWGAKVEQCKCEAFTGGGARHATTVLFNGRGGEMTVARVIDWGYAGTYVFILHANSSLSVNAIFGVGDTIHVRKPTRSLPLTVLPASDTRCDVRGLVRPPSEPPPPPHPPSPPLPPASPPNPPTPPPPPESPPPPIGDVFCPVPGYSLEYDAADGDKCRGAGDATNWTAIVGCVDSLYAIPALNGPGRAPRVVKQQWQESTGHTTAWGSYVEKTKVEDVEGDVSRHSTTILYNARGDELEVKRVLHWGHASQWVFILCYDAARAPSTIFSVGDTIYVKKLSRTSPNSVLPGSDQPCTVSKLMPPQAPPTPPPTPPLSPSSPATP